MTVTTYHSSKGLECKVCILLNVDNLNDKKLVYVGMTRASEKLCIHSFSPDEGKTFKELLSCYEELMAPIKNDTLTFASFDSVLEEENLSTEGSINNEIEYPVKSEHLIEPNLWEEEETARHH